MRLIGIVLVLVGALALGIREFAPLPRGQYGVPPEHARADRDDDRTWVPTVLGGIAVVTGLLLVATDARRN